MKIAQLLGTEDPQIAKLIHQIYKMAQRETDPTRFKTAVTDLFRKKAWEIDPENRNRLTKNATDSKSNTIL